MPHRIPKDLKTILLDLDETIYDQKNSCEMGLKAVAETFTEFKAIPIEELENKYFIELHNIHLQVIDGHLTEEEAHIHRFKIINENFNLSEKSNDEYLTMIEIYNRVSQSNKRPIPGAIDTVSHLKEQGYCIGIITNGKTENQKRKTDLCGIGDMIDFLIISEEIGIRKPSPEIFSIALEKANCTNNQAIMIGDSWDSDITGSFNADIQPIWYNRGRHENYDTEKVIEINHIEDLKLIL